MEWTRAFLTLVTVLVLYDAGTAVAQQLNGEAAKGYADFQSAIPQRAIAVSPDSRNYAWWSGMSGRDPGNAVNNAMGRCAERAKTNCQLYAVNNVLVAGREWNTLMPAPTPPIGRLASFPWWQNKGPQAAAGLLVWSHGYREGVDATASGMQQHVGRFLNAGYDLYRFDREYIRDWPGDSTALAEATRQAKSMGYKRVILAGQSAGAWASLAAVMRGAPADGVISVAAAHHGEMKDMRDMTRARSEWQQIVRGIKPGPRIVVVNFADDTYDVGGRMDDAKSAFASSGVQSVVIDNPPNLKGHSAGYNAAFTRTYAACIFAFIETGTRNPPCN